MKLLLCCVQVTFVVSVTHVTLNAEGIEMRKYGGKHLAGLDNMGLISINVVPNY